MLFGSPIRMYVQTLLGNSTSPIIGFAFSILSYMLQLVLGVLIRFFYTKIISIFLAVSREFRPLELQRYNPPPSPHIYSLRLIQ